MHQPIFLSNLQGEYQDEYGNVIYGDCLNCKIYIHGDNNFLDFRGADISNTEISIGNNCSIELGQNVKFMNNRVDLSTAVNSKIKIEDKVECNSGKIIMFPESKLIIHERTTIWYSFDFVIEFCSECIIGRDSMFSSFVKLDTSDGHSIFDTALRKNINSVGENKYHKVILEEHTWIGKDSFVLGNCHIGAGSIVGARSLVKGTYPNNCIIAGCMGRVIAKNRSWSREYMAENISMCGSGHVELTKE